jgi:hypothetical protein
MSFYGRAWIVFSVFAASAPRAVAADADDAKTADAPERVESEISIHVPDRDVERVWQYLTSLYGSKQAWPAGLDASAYTTRVSDERFVDRYFDTPELSVLAQQSGVRHRLRDIPGAPDDPKDDRQLLQVKVTSAGDTITRGEYKFPIKNKVAEQGGAGRSAVELIKEKHRKPFEKLMRGIGVDPAQLEEVIRVDQRRRRVYFADATGPALTVTMDQVEARKWWAKAPWTEIEVEIGEIRYTQASPAERKQLEQARAAIRADLLSRFPGLTEDDSPKYTEAFARLEKKVPMLRRLIAARKTVLPVSAAGVGTVMLVGLVILFARNRRARGGSRKLAVVQ